MSEPGAVPGQKEPVEPSLDNQVIDFVVSGTASEQLETAAWDPAAMDQILTDMRSFKPQRGQEAIIDVLDRTQLKRFEQLELANQRKLKAQKDLRAGSGHSSHQAKAPAHLNKQIRL